jgi:hypothetical protein
MVLANDLIRLRYVWCGALLNAPARGVGALSRVTVERSAIAIAHVGDKLQRISLAFSRAISSIHQ